MRPCRFRRRCGIACALRSTARLTDARRALYARFVLDHRLSAQDPLAPGGGDWERQAAEMLFSERKVTLAEIAGSLIRADS